MEQVFLPREARVLSGSMLGWGDSVVARCDAVVFLTLNPAERLRRIEARDRVRRESGRVDEAALTAFLTWARGYDEPSCQGRSRTGHEDWLATLTCPILRLVVPFREKHCATRCSVGFPPRAEPPYMPRSAWS